VRDALGLAAQVGAREVSPRELVDAAIERIEATNPELNFLVTECYLAAREAADGAPTALPTGHPLASIFLLKYGPQAQELQEGVAFHGRAGTALIKSLQRLHVDPLEVYGTNCVKFAGCDLGVSAEWLRRELAIVEPKLVVVMGEDALEVLNDLDVPLARPLEPRPGEIQSLTPSIDALYTPNIDEALDEEGAKRAFWRAFQTLGAWYADLPPY